MHPNPSSPSFNMFSQGYHKAGRIFLDCYPNGRLGAAFDTLHPPTRHPSPKHAIHPDFPLAGRDVLYLDPTSKRRNPQRGTDADVHRVLPLASLVLRAGGTFGGVTRRSRTYKCPPCVLWPADIARLRRYENTRTCLNASYNDHACLGKGSCINCTVMDALLQQLALSLKWIGINPLAVACPRTVAKAKNMSLRRMPSKDNVKVRPQQQRHTRIGPPVWTLRWWHATQL